MAVYPLSLLGIFNLKNWTIFKPIIDLYNALFNNDNGFSFRKLGALFAMYSAYKLQLTLTTDSSRQTVIMAWMTFSSVCIGLVTIPDLIKFLNKDKTITETKTNLEINETTKTT